MNPDFSYRFNIFKSGIKDRFSGLKRKQVLSGLVTLLMIALLPATMALVSQVNNVKKQAASCSTTSFLGFTNENDETITKASINNTVRVHVYVTKILDAADIVLNFDNNKIRPIENGIHPVGMNSFSHIRNPQIINSTGILFSIARSLGGSININGKIAYIDFKVVSGEELSTTISYGSQTVMASVGNASGASCGTAKTILLNQPYPVATATTAPTEPGANTVTPTQPQDIVPVATATTAPYTPEYACPNYERNCKPKTQDCPASTNYDPKGRCGQEFKCCVPVGNGSVPQATPTTSASSTACPNYAANCVPNAQGCPSYANLDPRKCGDGFKCCVPFATATPTPTPATHPCLNYEANCKPVTSCPVNTNRDEAGQCGLGFICCLPK